MKKKCQRCCRYKNCKAIMPIKNNGFTWNDTEDKHNWMMDHDMDCFCRAKDIKASLDEYEKQAESRIMMEELIGMY